MVVRMITEDSESLEDDDDHDVDRPGQNAATTADLFTGPAPTVHSCGIDNRSFSPYRLPFPPTWYTVSDPAPFLLNISIVVFSSSFPFLVSGSMR